MISYIKGKILSISDNKVSILNGNIAFAGVRLAYHFTFRRQEIY